MALLWLIDQAHLARSVSYLRNIKGLQINLLVPSWVLCEVLWFWNKKYTATTPLLQALILRD